MDSLAILCALSIRFVPPRLTLAVYIVILDDQGRSIIRLGGWCSHGRLQAQGSVCSPPYVVNMGFSVPVRSHSAPFSFPFLHCSSFSLNDTIVEEEDEDEETGAKAGKGRAAFATPATTAAGDIQTPSPAPAGKTAGRTATAASVPSTKVTTGVSFASLLKTQQQRAAISLAAPAAATATATEEPARKPRATASKAAAAPAAKEGAVPAAQRPDRAKKARTEATPVTVSVAPTANPWAKASSKAPAAAAAAAAPATASPAPAAVRSGPWSSLFRGPEPPQPEDGAASPALSVGSGRKTRACSRVGALDASMTQGGDAVSVFSSATKQPVEELTEHKLQQRDKQIALGKATEAYKRYAAEVPREARVRGKIEHPMTPDRSAQCSKRSWVGQVSKWRRQLHVWDPSASAMDLSVSERVDEDAEEEQAQH
jgi:hypothetical protein